MKNAIISFGLFASLLQFTWADNIDQELLQAAKNGDVEETDRLLEAGMDVDAEDY
jgi:hypothetical protein